MPDLKALAYLGMDELPEIAEGDVTVSGSFIPMMQGNNVYRLELDVLKALIDT